MENNRFPIKGNIMVLIITFVFITNIISIYYTTIGIVLAFVEIAILLKFLVSGNLEKYISCYILFITTSFEVADFVFLDNSSNIYNFLYLPIMNRYHIYILALLPLIMIIKNGRLPVYWSKLHDIKELKKFNNGLLLLICCGLIGGYISYLFNDNNIQSSFIHFSVFRRDILSFLLIFLIGFYISYLLVISPEFYKKLECFLQSILLAILPSALITIILNLKGNYGNNDVLLMPLVSYFGISIMIFPLYNQYKKQKKLFFWGILLFIIMLSNPSPLGGKWWLLALIIPLIWVIKYLQQMTMKKLVLIHVFLILFLVIIFYIVPMVPKDNIFHRENTLSQYKLDQAISLITFWEEDWFEKLPSSPKFRIDEFINLLYEYFEKPQYLLFGKGFGGSLTKHTHYLDWNSQDAFSIGEINEGLFFNLHFALNVFFLKFGLIGLVFFIGLIYSILKHINYNPWLFIGLIWAFFYFNYYISLYFGLCSLLLGFYKKYRDSIKVMQINLG